MHEFRCVFWRLVTQLLSLWQCSPHKKLEFPGGMSQKPTGLAIISSVLEPNCWVNFNTYSTTPPTYSISDVCHLWMKMIARKQRYMFMYIFNLHATCHIKSMNIPLFLHPPWCRYRYLLWPQHLHNGSQWRLKVSMLWSSRSKPVGLVVTVSSGFESKHANKTISSSVTFQEKLWNWKTRCLKCQKMQIPHISLCWFSILRYVQGDIEQLVDCSNVYQKCPMRAEDRMMVFSVFHGPPCQTHKRQNLKMDLENESPEEKNISLWKVSFSGCMWSYKNVFFHSVSFHWSHSFPGDNIAHPWKLNLEISWIETWQVKVHHVPRLSLIIPLSYYVIFFRVPHSFHFCHKMCLCQVVVPPLHQAHLHQPRQPPMDL